MKHLPAPSGDPRREATEPRRGYLYQDYRTALEWFRLDHDEVLFVEVTEDYVTRRSDHISAAQVKDVAKPISLVSKEVKKALNSFVELRESHPEDTVKLAFITSGGCAREKRKSHRPDRTPALKYWNQAARNPDIDVSPLKKALLNTELDQPLLNFVKERDAQELRRDLIEPVTWIFHAGSLLDIKERLTRKLAAELQKRNSEPADSSRYVSKILNEIINCAVDKDRNRRRLTRGDLDSILAEISSTRISNQQLNEYQQKALIAEHLPVSQFDEHVQAELDVLRLSRWFVGFDSEAKAKSLANKVLPRGIYFSASAGIRVRALSWAARILSNSQPEAAKDLIREASNLGPDFGDLQINEALVFRERSEQEAFRQLQGLRDPEANTARYLVIRQRASDEQQLTKALSWFQGSSLPIDQFDEDGQALIIRDLLHAGEWDSLSEIEISLKAQKTRHPFLLLNLALLNLCKAIHPLSRMHILEFPPLIQSDQFHLYDSAQGSKRRVRALDIFTRLIDVSQELNLHRVEDHAREYEIWLRTRDQSLRPGALSELRALVTQEVGWERWVPLALGANVDFDYVGSRESLIAELRTYRSLSFDQARALLALLILPSEVAAGELSEYRSVLRDHFAYEFLLYMEFSGYLSTGRFKEAEELTKSIKSSEIREQCANELRIKSADVEDSALLDDLVAIYEKTESVADLHNLVEALARREDWDAVAVYSRKLFEELLDVRSAEGYIRALWRSENFAESRKFFEHHQKLAHSSSELSSFYTQALLSAAQFEALRGFLASAPMANSAKRLASLHTALLEMDRLRLGQIVTEELADPSGVPAKDLALLSTIAGALSRDSDARELAIRATKEAHSDPGILMWAYLQATRSMWRDQAQADEWLRLALENSSKEGPVFTASFKDLENMLPEWRSRAQATWEDLLASRIWLHKYAASSNLQLSEVLVGQADFNYRTSDARKRVAIPAFSGSREPRRPQRMERIALDHTTILLLAYLGLLDRVHLLADKVCIPHGTGTWLLEELSQAAFHQPSQIEEAQRILEFSSSDNVRVAEIDQFAIDAVPLDFGAYTSGFIGLALDSSQRGEEAIAVLGSPANSGSNHVETILEEERLSSVVCDLACLLRALNECGSLPEKEYRAAFDFAKAVGSHFQSSARLGRHTTLVLDDLAVKYLAHLGLLDCVSSAGYDVVISTSVRDRARELSKVKDYDKRHQSLLHDIFGFFGREIKSGFVSVLPQPEERWGTSDETSVSTLDFFSCTEHYDAIFVDDRFFNRWQTLETSEGRQVPVHCTLDALMLLHQDGCLTDQEYYELLGKLRRSGFCVIAVDAKELEFLADDAVARFGGFRETNQLASVRENVSLTQLQVKLDFQSEGNWYRRFLKEIGEFLDTAGSLSDTRSRISARNWFLELSDLSRFSECLGVTPDHEGAQLIRNHAQVKLIIDALSHDYDRADAKSLSAYFAAFSWAHARDFAYLVEQAKRIISDFAHGFDSETASSDSAASKRAFLALLLSRLPEPLNREVLVDSEWLSRHSIPTTTELTLSIPERPRFQRDALYESSAAVVLTGSAETQTDSEGGQWCINLGDKGSLRIAKEGEEYLIDLPHLELALPERSRRVQYLCGLLKSLHISRTYFEDVELLAKERPLTASDIEKFDQSLRHWPSGKTEQLVSSIRGGHVDLAELIPDSKEYYSSLLEKIEASMENVQSNSGVETSDREVMGDICDGLLATSWLNKGASHLLRGVRAVDLANLVDEVCRKADPWSTLGLLEGILEMCEPQMVRKMAAPLLGRLRKIANEESDELRLFVETAKVIDLRVRALFGDDLTSPSFRRRASFSHASVVMRAFSDSRSEIQTTIEHMEAKALGYTWGSVADLRYDDSWTPHFFSPRFVSHWIRKRVSTALESREDCQELLAIGREACEDWEQFFGEEELDEGLLALTPFSTGKVSTDSDLERSEQIISSLSETGEEGLLTLWAQISFLGCGFQLSHCAYEALAESIDARFHREVQRQEVDDVANALVLISLCAVLSGSEKLRGAAFRAAEQYRKGGLRGAPAVTYFVSTSILAAAAPSHCEWVKLVSQRAYGAAVNCTSRKEALTLKAIFEWIAIGDWQLEMALGRAQAALGLFLGDPSHISSDDG